MLTELISYTCLKRKTHLCPEAILLNPGYVWFCACSQFGILRHYLCWNSALCNNGHGCFWEPELGFILLHLKEGHLTDSFQETQIQGMITDLEGKEGFVLVYLSDAIGNVWLWLGERPKLLTGLSVSHCFSITIKNLLLNMINWVLAIRSFCHGGNLFHRLMLGCLTL